MDMIKEESKWDQIKTFVNDTKSFRFRDIPFGATGQIYINYLHKAGFLNRPKKGYYLLNIIIEKNITLHNVTDYAYGSKKGKIKKLVRKEKLKKIDINNENGK